MKRPEQKLWTLLRKRELNIRRQAPIGRYIVDFVSHAACLVIELDGPWHDDPDVNLRDAERTQWLNSQGYRVIRYANKDVLADPSGVADQIEAAITGKALPPSMGEGWAGVWPLRRRNGWVRRRPSPSRRRRREHPQPRPFPHRGGREKING